MAIVCPNGTLDVLTRNNGSDLLLYSKFAPPLNELFEVISYPIWCSLGLPGSILSTYIWSRRKMRHSGSSAAAVYQTTLGLIDTSFFVVQLFWYLHTVWKLKTLDRSVLCEGFAIANYFIQYSSPMLTLIFTTERYIAICFPFKAGSRQFGNNFSSAVKLTVICFGICAILSSAQGVFYTISDGKCGLRMMFETEGESARIFYTSWTMFTELIIFGLIPTVCLILDVLVILTLKKIKKESMNFDKNNSYARRYRQCVRNSSVETTTSNIIFDSQRDIDPANRNSKTASTITLLCVSFYLIFAHFSVALMVLLYLLLPMGNICLTDEQIVQDPVWQASFRFFTIRSVIESFGISHFAAKFYIYIATSKLFREQCLMIFSSCTSRKLELSRNESFASPYQIVTRDRYHSQARSSTESSNLRLTNSHNQLNRYSGRWSISSFGSQNRRFSSLSKPRSQPGISKTVLNKIGERVPIN